MAIDSFSQAKKDTLSREDKSSIGKWDEKILKLCEKINKNKNYYTTSSCSGRILLMVEQEKKGKGLFLKIYHNIIPFKELKRELKKLLMNKNSIKNCNDNSKIMVNKFNQSRNNLNIKFKQEPFIIHIACKDIDYGKKILNLATKIGIKRAGIIGINKKVVVELNGSEKLEFPIIHNGKLLVDDDFLRLIVKRANNKMKKSWEIIKRLERLI